MVLNRRLFSSHCRCNCLIVTCIPIHFRFIYLKFPLTIDGEGVYIKLSQALFSTRRCLLHENGENNNIF